MQVSASFVDGSGNLLDPDVVTFLFQPPGQAQATYTYPTNITRSGVGRYSSGISAATYIGLYTYRFQSTGYGQTTTYDQTFTSIASAFGR